MFTQVVPPAQQQNIAM